MVEVKFFATLIDFTGRRKIEVNGVKTVSELLDMLDDMFPGFKRQLESGYIILVNGRNILHLNGLETELDDRDTVSIFPPVGGG